MFGPPVRADVIIFARDGRSIMDRPLDSDEPVKNFYADPELIRRAFKIFDEAGIEARLADPCRISIEGSAEAFKTVFGVELTYTRDIPGGTSGWSTAEGSTTLAAADGAKAQEAIGEVQLHCDSQAACPKLPGDVKDIDLYLGELGTALSKRPPRIEKATVDKITEESLDSKTIETIKAWRETLPSPDSGTDPPRAEPSLRIFELYIEDQLHNAITRREESAVFKLSLARVSAEQGDEWKAMRHLFAQHSTFEPMAALHDLISSAPENSIYAYEEIAEEATNLASAGAGKAAIQIASYQIGRKKRDLIDISKFLEKWRTKITEIYAESPPGSHATMVVSAAASILGGTTDIKCFPADLRDFWSSHERETPEVLSASFQIGDNRTNISDFWTARQAALTSKKKLRFLAIGNKGGQPGIAWSRPKSVENLITVGGYTWTQDRCIASDKTYGGHEVDRTDLRVVPDLFGPTESTVGGAALYPFTSASKDPPYENPPYERGGGSSLSTPTIAAAAVLVWRMDTEMTASQLRDVLLEAANDSELDGDGASYIVGKEPHSILDGFRDYAPKDRPHAFNLEAAYERAREQKMKRQQGLPRTTQDAR